MNQTSTTNATTTVSLKGDSGPNGKNMNFSDHASVTLPHKNGRRSESATSSKSSGDSTGDRGSVDKATDAESAFSEISHRRNGVGDIHYDDGASRMSSIEPLTVNNERFLHGRPSTVSDLEAPTAPTHLYHKNGGSMAASKTGFAATTIENSAPIKITQNGFINVAAPSSLDGNNLEEISSLEFSSSASSIPSQTSITQQQQEHKHHESTAMTKEKTIEFTSSKSETSRRTIRRIRSIVSYSSHSDILLSVDEEDEEDQDENEEISFRSKESQTKEEYIANRSYLGPNSYLQEEQDDDEDEEEDNDDDDVQTVHTEDPQVIAIGIVQSALGMKTTPETTQLDSLQVEENEKISEAVAKNIAQEEHDIKMQNRTSTGGSPTAASHRRRSAPSILSARKTALEMGKIESDNNNNSRLGGTTSRASFSGPSLGNLARGGRCSKIQGPNKSFLQTLSGDTLPRVMEPMAPPIKRTKWAQSNNEHESYEESADDNLASKCEVSSTEDTTTVPPHPRGRKALGSSGTTMLSDSDREAKMRTVRGALGATSSASHRQRRIIQRPIRSTSNASTSQPIQPTRKMSESRIISTAKTQDENVDAAAIIGSNESLCEPPSLRSFQSMQSTRSITSTSSGIDLDEKTRERLIARSALLCARKPIRTLSGNDSSNNRSQALTANECVPSLSPMTGDDEKIGTGDSSLSSRPSDDKRNMRISPSVSQASHSPATSIRPSDEKADYRRDPFSTAFTSSRRESLFSNSTAAQRVSLVENEHDTSSAFSTGRDGSAHVHDVVEGELPFGPMTTSDVNSNDSQMEDLEAQAGVPVILPGAFAVGGLDEEGEDGYDSGFEDNDIFVNNIEEVEVPEQRPSSIDGVSGTVVASTPLQAELYEGEEFVAAEVLIEEEDPEEKVFRRSFFLQFGCAFFVVLAIAGVVIGVVLPNANKRNNKDSSEDEFSVPVVEGWTQIGETLTVPAYKDAIRFGNSVSISGDGTRIAVGLPGSAVDSNNNLKSTGSVSIFDLINGTEWEETFQIYGRYTNAELGTKVILSADGERLAVGAPSYSADQGGYVEVYEEDKENDIWILVGEVITNDEAEGEVFGDSIGFSSDGTTIAVGDKYSDRVSDKVKDTGVVRVYKELNNTWVQIGESLNGSEQSERFGWAVALSGDGTRLAASSLGTNNIPGTVQTFDFTGENWTKVGSTIEGESTREAFGASVALSDDGSILASGATGYSRDGQEAGVGIVRSYQFDSVLREWSSFGQSLEGTNSFDSFGSSIALSHAGDIIAIGGPENENFCDNCGHIQVFQNQEGTWNRIGSELGKNESDGGQFGFAVALSSDGTRVVGAAPFTTFNGFVSKVGQVLVFETLVLDDNEERL